MKIQLIDKNIDLINEWEKYFSNYNNFSIIYSDLFKVKTDCIVSPANSFGIMNHGLDSLILKVFGNNLQDRIQDKIKKEYNNNLLVGQAFIIETYNKNIPYCIVSPTMRVPTRLGNKDNNINAYLASKAIFDLLKNINYFDTISITGLGTGKGGLSPKICATQMKQAYIDSLNNFFPNNLEQAIEHIHYLNQKKNS